MFKSQNISHIGKNLKKNIYIKFSSKGLSVLSFKVPSKLLSDDITAPTTGRMKDGERMLDINHLQWVVWLDWMYELSKHKYGVQLGTAAAGTFNLNCAYLGIPCIGYDNVNTQKYLHPDLSVPDGDVESARKLAIRLNDDDFYQKCSEKTKKLYEQFYSEEVYIKKMKNIFKNNL